MPDRAKRQVMLFVIVNSAAGERDNGLTNQADFGMFTMFKNDIEKAISVVLTSLFFGNVIIFPLKL
jgi:hypothetical protein